WKQHRARDVWNVFLKSCRRVSTAKTVLREGAPVTPDLRRVCEQALSFAPLRTHAQARNYFERLFQPFAITHIQGRNPYEQGFLTGYYEPLIAGSLVRTAGFTEAVLARPNDLITDAKALAAAGLPPELSAGRKDGEGKIVPYFSRQEIDAGAVGERTKPLLWLRDGIELFMLQVQGSGRVRLPDGRVLRLAYDGRNGRPYTSIGRLLVERGHINRQDMSLARLKAWVRANGQGSDDAGRKLMQENHSYVFFRIDESLDAKEGPIGGEGIPLTRLHSIAVDRNLWAYGLPFWIEARLPWRRAQEENFARLMIAQDTGSAILGAARADIFFGTGARAGRLAGNIRHAGRFIVFLPRGPD
ncbi:MAG: transglycosylase, partial [Alphaproteobacteria bacterium]|nr:transglycosylase [Alphaproteobacteria bacterium]